MEQIVIKNSNIIPIIDNWENTFDIYKDKVLELNSVRSRSISEHDAFEWLTAASKLYSPIAVEKLLDQASGFGAKDIRTLIAGDRNEYYPTDSTSEVYDRKLLKTVSPPNNQEAEKERIIFGIARTILLKRYSLNRDTITENLMSKPSSNSKAEWLVGKPALIGNYDNESLLFDFQLSNTVNEISQEDKIKLHYYDLVANNIARPPHQLNLVKIFIDPNMVDTLITLSKLSKESENSIIEIAKEFEKLPKTKFNLEVHQVEKQPELYKEIITSGQKHWANVIDNNIPSVKQDPPLYMTKEQEETYIQKSKSCLVASESLKAAEIIKKQSMKDLIDSMKSINIDNNFTPPHLGVLLRKYDHFDIESAGLYLEQTIGIDPLHLRTTKLNTDLLIQAFERMGGDISNFYEKGNLDKKSIESVAEEIGLDLSSFYKREMKVVINPKTRGPIYDTITQIRETAKSSIESINNEIIKSDLIDSKSLIRNSDVHVPKQNTLNI